MTSSNGSSPAAPLDCSKCPAFCCRMAGYVEVRRADIRRLAKHLGLTVREFEARHVLRTTRKGEKLIKEDGQTCPFLTPDRKCGVYAARPADCRGYVCWDQDDQTVHHFAKFTQLPVETLRSAEKGGT